MENEGSRHVGAHTGTTSDRVMRPILGVFPAIESNRLTMINVRKPTVYRNSVQQTLRTLETTPCGHNMLRACPHADLSVSEYRSSASCISSLMASYANITIAESGFRRRNSLRRGQNVPTSRQLDVIAVRFHRGDPFGQYHRFPSKHRVSFYFEGFRHSYAPTSTFLNFCFSNQFRQFYARLFRRFATTGIVQYLDVFNTGVDRLVWLAVLGFGY